MVSPKWEAKAGQHGETTKTSTQDHLSPRGRMLQGGRGLVVSIYQLHVGALSAVFLRFRPRPREWSQSGFKGGDGIRSSELLLVVFNKITVTVTVTVQ